MNGFKRPTVIEAEDAMVELCRVLGVDIGSVELDMKTGGYIRHKEPVPVIPDTEWARMCPYYHVLAHGEFWSATFIQWKLCNPERFGLKHPQVTIKDDRYKVYVEDVDGRHEIGSGCTWEVADAVAMSWLGEHYNETGAHSWVGSFGSVVYVEENPKSRAATMDDQLKEASKCKLYGDRR